MMRRKANRILVWGIALLVLGAVLGLFVPNIILAMSTQHVTTQLASGAGEILLRTVNTIVPALGAALVASGIVLRTIAGRDDQPEQRESIEAAERSRSI